MRVQDGYSALLKASEGGNTDTITALIEAKADLNLQNEVGTPAVPQFPPRAYAASPEHSRPAPPPAAPQQATHAPVLLAACIAHGASPPPSHLCRSSARHARSG